MSNDEKLKNGFSEKSLEHGFLVNSVLNWIKRLDRVLINQIWKAN